MSDQARLCAGAAPCGRPVPRWKKTAAAFTLIELLVVVAIIAVLISILVPSLYRVRELANRAVCLTNQKGVYNAAAFYWADSNNWLPPGCGQQMGNLTVYPFTMHAGWGGGQSWTAATFYSKYVGLHLNPLANRIARPKGMMWCPSGNRRTIAGWSNWGWDTCVDYRLPGLAVYGIDIPWSMVRAEKLWGHRPYGPRAFSLDATCKDLFPAYPGHNNFQAPVAFDRTPHKTPAGAEGLNLLDVDGAGEWVPAARCAVRGDDYFGYYAHLEPLDYEIVYNGAHPGNMRDGTSASQSIMTYRAGLPAWVPAAELSYKTPN